MLSGNGTNRMPPEPMTRIASLLPSTTEIACALGFERELVGRSHECDFPATVARLPVLTEPKLDPTVSGPEIDRQVRTLVSEGLSVYRVDADALRALRPTHILTQDQCEVCAASLRDVEDALAQWLGDRPTVVSLRPASLGDVFDDVQRVADALREGDRGRACVRELSDRITAVGERTSGLRERPRVACVEWIDPLMAAGNWMPELVTLAGGESIFGEVGRHSAWIEWEELRAANPDAIVVLPCGFDLARTRAEMPPLMARPGFHELRAVRDGRVFLVDGNQYFNRPGPRLVESLTLLAEMLHPDIFGTEHRGSAWETLA
jgi:iron complex transport system substrate-binding protein